MLDYKIQADNDSMYNTPPAYGIYICGKVFKWLLRNGGLEEMKLYNEKKAAILYDFLDSSKLFKGTVRKEDRSLMNVPFVTGSEEMDAEVVKATKAAGFDIPESTKVVALKVDAVGKADVLNKEIMGPIVVLKGYDTFENAVDMAVNNMVESGGIGHTAGIFSNDEAHVRYAGERIPVARLLVNQPTPDAWGPATNSLSPAVSEGCGTWGNNILADNVDYIHMINVSKIVMPLDVELPDGEKIFAD